MRNWARSGRRLPRRLSRLGIGDKLPETEAKYIALANIATYASILVNVPALPLVFKVANPVWSTTMGTWFVLTLMAIWFRSRSWHWLATTLVMVSSMVWVAAATWIFGTSQQSHVYFIVLLAVTFFVYPPAHARTMATLAGLSALAFVLESFFGPVEGLIDLGDDALADRATNIIGFTVLVTAIVYYERRIVDGVEVQLADERLRGEASLKREIARQVAERSRDLGEALARSDGAVTGEGLRPDERFDQRYRVVRPLGSGGMGSVYEVERVSDTERLALKVVTGGLTGTQAARFAREAELGARLHHENLVATVDVGVVRGAPYLVMELVTGGSLEDRRGEFGRMQDVLPVLRQIAEGLGVLHDFGVVHRDLKPSNILVSTRDMARTRVKIGDFGISRLAVPDSASLDPHALTKLQHDPQTLTNTAAVLGTLRYLAPEGAHGGRAVEAPGDVFAFGLLAYEMLTGRFPFRTIPAVVAMAGLPGEEAEPLAVKSASVRLQGLVMGCLVTDPTKRPNSRDLLAALRDEA